MTRGNVSLKTTTAFPFGVPFTFSEHGGGIRGSHPAQQGRGIRGPRGGFEEQSGGDLLLRQLVPAVPRLHAHPVRLLHGAGGGERAAGSVRDSFRLLRQDVRRHGGILSRHARRLAGSALDG